jgi:hypothetical protein
MPSHRAIETAKDSGETGEQTRGADVTRRRFCSDLAMRGAPARAIRSSPGIYLRER